MVSLDAATGELLWRESDEAATSRMEAARSSLDDDEQIPVVVLVAVDGHLLEVSSNRVRGLG
jgi:hypothetical protein